VSDSPPGSLKSSDFFDFYPRFYETSETSPHRARLNLRYEAIFAENRDIFAGARVLDIASHDGRFSLAALATGATEVICIEARPELVENSHENLAYYGYGPEQARFINGDVFQVLAEQDFDVDVVLCLGFLYHTLRYNELLSGIRRANPRHVVIDTVCRQAVNAGYPAVNLHAEPVAREGNAVADRFSHGERIVVGQPNVRAVRTMMQAYDFAYEGKSDWAGLLRDNPDATHVDDYAKGLRVTLRFADARNS
jgi:hypothetical protein